MSFNLLSKIFSSGKKDENPQYTMGMHQSKQYTKHEPGAAQAKPTTFGQERAFKMEERLQTAIRDRQRLARAQGAAGSDLQSYYDRKAQIAENRIKNLQDSSKDAPY